VASKGERTAIDITFKILKRDCLVGEGGVGLVNSNLQLG
jgi:hypothetical protein